MAGPYFLSLQYQNYKTKNTLLTMNYCLPKINTLCHALLLIVFILVGDTLFSQTTVKGTVIDKTSGETLIGVNVIVKGTTDGAATDLDGKFEFQTTQTPPLTLEASFMGYQPQTYTMGAAGEKIKFKMVTKNYELKAIEIVETRISEKQKESALTVESMDVIAIKETPAANFYEGLGALKGVDLTSASIGFKVINTRGFNSTSPVRSLQIIDGVDNQAPGLNFSLGNFLGASELDVMKVDLIVGASSAFYGPNAFNGVISMTTKDPFLFPGLDVSMKVGERSLLETGVRYAHVFKTKKENSYDRWAFKLNFSFMQADDWEATNYDPVYNSETGADNWGGYDAVNNYGDEDQIFFDSPNNQVQLPGLGLLHRTGYREVDIVDYDTENIKTSAAIHHKLTPTSQLIASSSFGTGTTVYQGDNRYSLKDILFFQHKLEYNSKNGFIRAYATQEDAGNSYDAVFTALLLQDMAKPIDRWSSDYGYYWATMFAPKVKNLPGFPSPQIINGQVVYDFNLADQIMAQYSDSLALWHSMARELADLGISPPGNFAFDDNIDRLAPGTAEFRAAFNDITSRNTFAEGGSRFWDRSALYHIHAERTFKLDTANSNISLITGANYRLYAPNSRGTIFSDTTSKITNYEYGGYVGLEKRFMDDKLKANATIRVDKNQNFPYVASPAASLVYNFDSDNILRLSFSSAIRNPTLQDQYLYYNVGTAILVGNIDGFDSLATIQSIVDLRSSQNPDTVSYFNVAPLVPEKVKTLEMGYRTMIAKRLYLDASYYFSFYRDFLGFNIGVDPVIDPNTNLLNPGLTQAYRVAANATDVVTTQGFSIGANYYFRKFFTINGNYSWNELNRQGSDDPIIPAFNTPRNKYNIGISARDINTVIKLSKKEDATGIGIHNYGFSVNYKWIQGFLYEGSPQFTGFVPTYDMVDAQISKFVPSIKTTFKVGASNLLNNLQFQVYGGPRVGRMAYFSILVELDQL